MNGLQEIRGLIAARYFNEPGFVQKMRLVVVVVERPAQPTGTGSVWPPTYYLYAQATIGDHQYDIGELIDKCQFDLNRNKAAFVDQSWATMCKGLVRARERQEERDAVLCG